MYSVQPMQILNSQSSSDMSPPLCEFDKLLLSMHGRAFDDFSTLIDQQLYDYMAL